MSKTQKNTTPVVKTAKTIKVKTLAIAIGFVIALVASFVGGLAVAQGYNDKVTADALSLAKKLSK